MRRPVVRLPRLPRTMRRSSFSSSRTPRSSGASMPFPIPHKSITIIGPLKPKLDSADSADDEGLRSASEDLMHAVSAKDADGVMEALRSAFSILDAQADAEDSQPE